MCENCPFDKQCKGCAYNQPKRKRKNTPTGLDTSDMKKYKRDYQRARRHNPDKKLVIFQAFMLEDKSMFPEAILQSSSLSCLAAVLGTKPSAMSNAIMNNCACSTKIGKVRLRRIELGKEWQSEFLNAEKNAE